MKRITTLFLVLSVFAVSVHAAGDAEKGKKKAQACAACHGVDGNSTNPTWPKIAGQGEKYFIDQLKQFKAGAKGQRTGPSSSLMYGMVAGLSDQDMQDLAAYFAGQKITLGVADDALVAKGQAIYRGGNTEIGSAACMACHGPAGKGNPAAGFPALAGQHAQYTYNQLKAFHNGDRKGDANAMMRNMVRKMSDEEMRAVAEYTQGLH